MNECEYVFIYLAGHADCGRCLRIGLSVVRSAVSDSEKCLKWLARVQWPVGKSRKENRFPLCPGLDLGAVVLALSHGVANERMAPNSCQIYTYFLCSANFSILVICLVLFLVLEPRQSRTLDI